VTGRYAVPTAALGSTFATAQRTVRLAYG